jgi:hypothetical protein
MDTRSGAEITTVNGDVVEILSPLSTTRQPTSTRWRTTWPRVETVVPQPDHLP